MATGRSEGIRVLEDFVCEAIPAPEVLLGSKGRGMNSGMHMAKEVVSRQPSVPETRVAELRKLSTRELLALMHRAGSQLSGQELLIIHDIAAERLEKDKTPLSEGAIELSREAMRAAVNKSA